MGVPLLLTSSMMDLPLWLRHTMTVPDASQVAILSRCLFQRTMVTWGFGGVSGVGRERDKQVLLMNVQTRWSCRTMGGRGRARWVKASVLASVSTNQISARPYTRDSANKRTNVLTNHRLFLYVLISLFFSCRFEHTHTASVLTSRCVCSAPRVVICPCLVHA